MHYLAYRSVIIINIFERVKEAVWTLDEAIDELSNDYLDIFGLTDGKALNKQIGRFYMQIWSFLIILF
jgi:hypothetical protein